jgi:uncharacterized protein YecE (DUF72 family)
MTPLRGRADIRIGCAGWSIPKAYAEHFPAEGSHLERYAQRFPAVEINSSFHRPHRPATYARWGSSVPEDFQFAVKVPKAITHENRLADTEANLKRFLSEVRELGSKLGPLLVQLPPSLPFRPAVVNTFFQNLREQFDGSLVCEPRHISWFKPEAEQLLKQFKVARVAADPARTQQAGEPGGWNGLIYYRLHGSPRMYYSAYSAEYLESLAQRLIETARSVPTWCIFDNTAEFAATGNALDLLKRVRVRR